MPVQIARLERATICAGAVPERGQDDEVAVSWGGRGKRKEEEDGTMHSAHFVCLSVCLSFEQ